MHIHPIRTDEDHAAALREIEGLWGAGEGTEAGDRLDVLVTLVEDYEERRWPIEPLDPVRAIEVAMEMNGHTRAELAALIGQSRATEILNRHRALTLPMIRKIASAWHVPEKVLVQEYSLVKVPHHGTTSGGPQHPSGGAGTSHFSADVESGAA